MSWHRIVALLWAGSVLGVSFVATPAKFLAESLGRATALDVGGVTFHVFGVVELLFLGVLLGLLFPKRHSLTPFTKVCVGLVTGVVVIQGLVLLPALNERVELVQQGLPLPNSPVHTIYGALEVFKVGLLVTVGRVRSDDVRAPSDSGSSIRDLKISASTTAPRSRRTQVGDGHLLVEDLATLDITGPSGAVFSAVSDQLITNLVTLQPGHAIGEHVKDEVDVLITVSAGSGELSVDGKTEQLGSDVVAIFPRGTTRSISAHSRLIYYSTHVRTERSGFGPRLGPKG